MLQEPTENENEIAKQVIDSCFQIHKAFGPGLLKSIEKIGKLQEAQTLTYMKLAGLNLGLLINFNVPMIKDGMRRFYMSGNSKNKNFASFAS